MKDIPKELIEDAKEMVADIEKIQGQSPASGAMPFDRSELKCACVHPDASTCVQSRSPLGFDDEDEYSIDDDCCECACHQKDEDGMDDWDRALGVTWEEANRD